MSAINHLSLATALSILLFVPTGPASASPPDISGTYTCTGSDPYSTPNEFSESLVIKKSGDTYKIQAIPTGDTFPYFLGTAIFTKGVDNAFADVYWNVNDASGFGAELFTIKSDGSLDATFIGNTRNKSGTETCVKAKS